jgi:hypothetical protein
MVRMRIAIAHFENRQPALKLIVDRLLALCDPTHHGRETLVPAGLARSTGGSPPRFGSLHPSQHRSRFSLRGRSPGPLRAAAAVGAPSLAPGRDQ